MLSLTLGLLATISSSTTTPYQVWYLYTNKGKIGILQGISFASIIIIALSSTQWIGYGIRFGAIWSAIIACIMVLSQLFTLIICINEKVFSYKHLCIFISVFLLMLTSSFYLPRDVIGLYAAIVGAFCFLPQAITMWKNRRDKFSSHAYSYFTAYMIIIANICWLLYGVSLKDIWIIIPEIFFILSGVIMIAAKKSKEY